MNKEQLLHHALSTLVAHVRALDPETVLGLSPVLRTCDALLAPEVILTAPAKEKPMTAARFFAEQAEQWGQDAANFIRDGKDDLASECARLAFGYADQVLKVRTR